mmetsp:Transcript_14348/g.17386  ORF Transcript_14348/g.17386 Transcript_14348/m.17386 type:complete len:128 (-) Transcript_14348:114-497(-)|eukprot:CAMPEP_0184030030 /NCGR_PEP_ID=MMETSP0955-20130417/1098_1 /TAXON_ID=627963 /ORGANISM="Aplanochytrium sp, Strain PBS07" /LENGTH=127 /DNA_ID=CAMNT_0026315283 /DNA_START=1869 /DNA_END=2252 /DNA_ORIENTATION=-
MEMPPFLSLSIDVINAAVLNHDSTRANKTIENLEIAGFKEDAERVRKVIGPMLDTSRNTKHMSKHERRRKKRSGSLYKNPELGQLVVHSENNGNPRQLERLPSVEMLWERSPTASKMLYQRNWPVEN